MLTLENVSKKRDAFLLANISLKLPKGYILGVIGENGAGKTTLLHILSGLYRADSGRICLDGRMFDEEEKAIRQEIGVVTHGEMFDRHGTLLANARRYGRYYTKYDEEILKSYGASFGLDMGRKYRQLSKGETLKFALAFALAHQPGLLLLDEPAANFDKEFREEFQKILRSYLSTGENTVILSTHMAADVERFADYLLFLGKGKQVLFGDIEKVRDSYRMVAGEAYKIRLLKDRIIHMEEGEFGAKALVKHSGRPYDTVLKVWEPDVEELMYHIVKGGCRG